MRRTLLLLAALSASSGVQPATLRGSDLYVEPPAIAAKAELDTELDTQLIAQETASWCWAASASMALTLLSFPNINPVKDYQCGVVAAAFPACDADCTKCDRALDSMKGLVGLLDRYQRLSLHGKSDGLKASFSPNYVARPDIARIKRSLDLSYPVIAGISPEQRPRYPDQAAHAVLITGYEDNYLGSGETWVVVRDPYPYADGENIWLNKGYPYTAETGRALVPWPALKDRMNLTSAVFLEKMTAGL